MGAATVVQSAVLDSSDGIVHAFSTRQGGVSQPPFAALNLGQSVGDDPAAVEENRRRFFGGFGIAAGARRSRETGPRRRGPAGGRGARRALRLPALPGGRARPSSTR